MKMRTHLIAFFLLVFSLVSCDKEPLESTAIKEAKNALEVEQELLGIVNDHRNSLNLNSLEFSAVAYEYANEHSEYMISKASISHDNFSSRASNISAQVNAGFVAENVAKDYLDASEAFQGWLSRSSHKKTMESEFTHTAVSVKIASDGSLYFTQIFYR